MDKQGYDTADLSQEDLKKVKKLEHEINHGTDTPIVVIAYDKK